MLALLFFALSHPDLAGIALEARGHVGVAAAVSGIHGETVDFHAGEHFPMQSVYKFPIALAVLNAVDQGSLQLNQNTKVRKTELVPPALHSPLRDKYPDGECDVTLRELLRYAVSDSDGTASDVLLRVIGGAPKVQAYVESLGITEVRVVSTEREMAMDNQVQYRNWATPRGMLALLQAFDEGRALSPAGSSFLRDLMTQTPTGLNRLRGRLPLGSVVAHKTGTSGTVNGVTAATNDVGLVTLPNHKTLAIAVFVSESPAQESVREGVIAKIARAAFDWAQSF